MARLAPAFNLLATTMTVTDDPRLAVSAGRSVPCGARFRTTVLALASARGVALPVLAAAALLLVPESAADPGPRDDEGEGLLEVGGALGATPDAAIRRSLAAALALAGPGARILPAEDVRRLETAVETLGYRNKTLAHALKRLSFQPLDGRITEVRDAARLFGFINEWCFDEDGVRRRFRELAPVYHPDTGIVACRERMAQLIDARNLLVRHVRTVYSSGDWAARRGGPSA
ncbi:hypothetical protein [Azospirillum picis]|uniref:J domain-containing protein n=1 Tax=Azospirillum picis TaxID=488438 RepID=A0ABU0MR22_9PROT|nr:hypothetical protein [Azospirillum picis]MBP2302352.1 hypothetical protein [Azospirillum picis]MDQ0535931.1 hypothetical protein [Azospirillum picis]